MAYVASTTFVDGNVLTAQQVEDNQEALRVYLHRGIVSGDLQASKWIDTRHIQPPTVDAYTGLQHGVTGYQGSQWAGGEGIRLTFATKALSGNGRQVNDSFHAFPNTAFSLAIRRPCKILYHYWWELDNGRDNTTAAYQVAADERRVYVVPYFGDLDQAYNYRSRCQETRNTAVTFTTAYPVGMARPIVSGGGYGARQGTFMQDYNSVGTATFGLAIHSLSNRAAIVNWGVTVEAHYL